MPPETEQAYCRIIAACRDLFERKTRDYGTAWRILRLPSLTDQIFIKAQRIRSIQEKGTQRVGDAVEGEFIGIVNYCLMALMQLEMQPLSPEQRESDLTFEALAERYDAHVAENFRLLSAKNHDYGEAWRLMRVSSITDIILMKVLRTKQIEDQQGRTLVSEGVEANYRDMINYAVFALIKLGYAEASVAD
ncbi:MAG: nucleotide modification associated domain-containing protein [Catalinimonas sp.]